MIFFFFLTVSAERKPSVEERRDGKGKRATQNPNPNTEFNALILFDSFRTRGDQQFLFLS